MSLLRALRAYIGLGPDEDYDELNRRPVPDKAAREPMSKAAGGSSNGRRRRGGYLDDLTAPSAGGDREVVDIRTAKIDARRADGSLERQPVGASSRSRSYRDRAPAGRSGLSENDQLLDELSVGLDDGASRRNVPPDASVGERVAEIDLGGSRPEEVPMGPMDDRPGDELASPPSTEDDRKGATVRSIDSIRRRPKTLTPESFADAKSVADDFKFGTPVVINLQGVDRELARRLVDFASGVCYSLDGSMEKLAPQVFLLTPDGHDVSEDDRRRIEERGYAR